MARYDSPMFFDSLVSMPDGPVVSVTLNLINGEIENERWSQFVAPRNGYDLRVASPDITFDKLDHLSRADLAVLEHIWDAFKYYDRYALRNWTHDKLNIPEWEDPEGSSFSIDHEDVFKALGKDDPKALVKDIKEYRDLKRALSRL
jgi:Protein of unknown function (DUF4065)